MTIVSDGANKLAVVGLLPGYNNIIDTNSYDLEKDLLHNISFIDLQLATYAIGTSVKDKNIAEVIQTLVNDAFKGKHLYSYKAFGANDSSSNIKKTFDTLISKYLPGLQKINGVRMIASSDSMATETISNNFGESLINQLAQSSTIMQTAKSFSLYSNFIKEMSYDYAFKLLNNETEGILQVLKASALGIQIALPRFFESSNYSHTLSVFFKLTSPSGDEESVKTLVLDPLKLLMILASPNSMTGISYAYPFIYKVTAHGNSYMALGYISDITISKGSMETVYSDKYLPLSIDVRLNIRTLSENFANIVNKNEEFDFNILGLQSPATSNPDAIQNKASGTVKPPELITLKI